MQVMDSDRHIVDRGCKKDIYGRWLDSLYIWSVESRFFWRSDAGIAQW